MVTLARIIYASRMVDAIDPARLDRLPADVRAAFEAQVQLDTGVEEITIVEINRTAVMNLMKINEIKEVFRDRRTNLVFDDGRRFLERSDDKWDLVAIDPLRSAALSATTCTPINSSNSSNAIYQIKVCS